MISYVLTDHPGSSGPCIVATSRTLVHGLTTRPSQSYYAHNANIASVVNIVNDSLP